MTTINKKLS